MSTMLATEQRVAFILTRSASDYILFSIQSTRMSLLFVLLVLVLVLVPVALILLVHGRGFGSGTTALCAACGLARVSWPANQTGL